MDDVPIRTRPAFASPYKSDQEILSAIKDRIKETVVQNGQIKKKKEGSHAANGGQRGLYSGRRST